MATAARHQPGKQCFCRAQRGGVSNKAHDKPSCRGKPQPALKPFHRCDGLFVRSGHLPSAVNASSRRQPSPGNRRIGLADFLQLAWQKAAVACLSSMTNSTYPRLPFRAGDAPTHDFVIFRFMIPLLKRLRSTICYPDRPVFLTCGGEAFVLSTKAADAAPAIRAPAAGLKKVGPAPDAVLLLFRVIGVSYCTVAEVGRGKDNDLFAGQIRRPSTSAILQHRTTGRTKLGTSHGCAFPLHRQYYQVGFLADKFSTPRLHRMLMAGGEPINRRTVCFSKEFGHIGG